jgi:DNA-directed RNA polymerase specialized sigma24 family protein
VSHHDEEGSITRCLGELIEGGSSDDAAQTLWERYYQQLVQLARKRLRAAPRGLADEEDIALSAFDSFCRGAAAGRYPWLGGRSDLWRLLVTITCRKVVDQLEREHAAKRDRRRLRNQTELDSGAMGEGVMARIIGREPSPEFAAVMAEQCHLLLDRLGDRSLQQIALWKMEGYENQDIARRMNCSLRSIERKLGLIRKTWLREGVA